MTGTSDREHARARALKSWGRQKLLEEPHLDLVILGHTHVPVIEEVEPGRYYVNGGDWVNHRTYLVLQDGELPTLQEWEG